MSGYGLELLQANPEKHELSSEKLLLPLVRGTVVTVVEVRGARARIVEPCKGWVSIHQLESLANTTVNENADQPKYQPGYYEVVEISCMNKHLLMGLIIREGSDLTSKKRYWIVPGAVVKVDKINHLNQTVHIIEPKQCKGWVSILNTGTKGFEQLKYLDLEDQSNATESMIVKSWPLPLPQEWEYRYDKSCTKVYYYNGRTYEWIYDSAKVKLADTAVSPIEIIEYLSSAPRAMPLGWEEGKGLNGKIFYYNPETGESMNRDNESTNVEIGHPSDVYSSSVPPPSKTLTNVPPSKKTGGKQPPSSKKHSGKVSATFTPMRLLFGFAALICLVFGCKYMKRWVHPPPVQRGLLDFCYA